MKRFACILVLTLFAFANPALAQGQPASPAPATPKAAPKEPNAYDKIPDEVLEEAYNFGKACAKDTQMRQYKDCDCMAVKYLDQRLELGPDAPQTFILQELQGECIDATEAAGMHYDKCMAQPLSAPTTMKLEEFCECFANTYVKLFEASGAEPGSGSFINTQVQAKLICQNPSMQVIP